MAEDYGEPWRCGPNELVTDCNGRLVSFDAIALEGGDRTIRRVAACVNALAGVPTESLTNPTEAQRFALAVLRGEANALILADYLQENHTAEQAARRAGANFVGRDHLAKTLRGLVEGFSREVYPGKRCWQQTISDGHKQWLLAFVKDAEAGG